MKYINMLLIVTKLFEVGVKELRSDMCLVNVFNESALSCSLIVARRLDVVLVPRSAI